MKYIVTARLEVEAESRLQALRMVGTGMLIPCEPVIPPGYALKLPGIGGYVSIEEAEPQEKPE